MGRESNDAFIEQTLTEMSRHPMIAFADELSGEADMRKQEEGDAGPFIERLARFLEGKDHALFGGLGVRAYVRIRPTEDMDVMIDPKHLQETNAFLLGEGATLQGTEDDFYFYYLKPVKLHVEVLVAKTPLCREALQNTVPRRFKERVLRIVRADFLAAMKVLAYAARKESAPAKARQDREDIRTLISGRHTTVDAIRVLLARHHLELVPALEEALGKSV